MLTNHEFLDVTKDSFRVYLNVDTSRSTKKLKTLHGHIAADLQEKLGRDYEIMSQGYGNDKEGSIEGRYYPKNVDITVLHHGKPVAGIAVKFVMRNYSQNSNNYFENMLGETANIRSNSVPYFQVFIIFDHVPYYKKDGTFSKYDVLTQNNIQKYIHLSQDNPDLYQHTPDKTLLIVLHLKQPEAGVSFRTSSEYAAYYLSVIDHGDLITYSDQIPNCFGNSVILNNYEDFMQRTSYLIQGRQKD